MIIGKVILKYAPFSFYHRVRAYYRRFRKSFHRPLNEKEFRNILVQKLNIKMGDVLFIHSSVDRLNINFTPFRLLSILIETVGEDGSLLFPAWHFTERAEDHLQKNRIFDIRKSPSALGLISELARRHPKAIRSLHPTTSIVAIGKHAELLLRDHGKSIYPCDEKSPFYKMMAFNAKIIGLGVTTEFLSFIHCPEDVLKEKFPFKTRTNNVFTVKIRDYDGNLHELNTLVADKSIAHRNIPKFIKKYISSASSSEFSIRGNSFFLVESALFYKEMVSCSEKGVTVYSN
jgi:aminoglycoside 3-N-acetyltransferase